MICPVCEAFDCGLVFFNTHNLAKCPHCSHVWQADKEITVSYDADYINAYFKHNSLRQMSLLRAGMAEGFIGSAPGVVLDFGYGSGDFLRVMASNGWTVYGVDVHGLKLGISENYHSPYDLITFFDSLEHLQDFKVLKDFNPCYFIVSVPIFRGKLGEIDKWKHYKPGEHLHYFTDKSIQRLFAKYNYKLSHKTHSEDLIRGSLDKNWNITTLFFRRADLK